MKTNQISKLLASSLLLLTGCNSLLYSDNQGNVPVYSDTNNSTGQSKVVARNGNGTKAPAVINSSSTDPYSDNTPSGVTEAIEKANKSSDKTVKDASGSLADTLKKGKVKSAEAILRPGAEAVSSTKENAKSAANKVENGIKTTVSDNVTKAKTSVKDTATNTTNRVKTEANKTVATAETKVNNATKANKNDTPAISTLYAETQKHIKAGNLSAASASMERANRIEPRNSGILFNIAKIKKAQENYKQAESFASKAAAYSKSKSLSKKIWNFLSVVRKQLGQNTAAASAAKKAASF